ncbi:unnamed protein product [Porites evermanni]|uniref:Hexosyltransferase n=1 Tax=Porites evermanni TaxID=104178 RepID=A0ABN8MLK3_9CNID|nr:unnamed protein product [Porites evermanni]
MSFYFPKRLRSLRSLVSFLFVGLLYIVYSVFFPYHGNEERVYFGHNLTRNALYFQANTGQHLSLLANHFKQLVEQYENERTNMEKSLDREAKITLLNNQTKLASGGSGEVFKQSVVCGSSDIFLLIQVHSSPNNFMKRHAIRLSWGNLEHFIGHRQGVIVRRVWKTVFIVGKSLDPTTDRLVVQEAAIYKDIVIGTFEDTFRNLYKKMIWGLTWPMEENCSASYILKTDEDCFVNIGNILNWLDRYHIITNGTQPIYAGRRQDNMPVVRDKENRYYLSEEEFPEEEFYPYASGGGYVFSGTLLPLLSNVSKTAPLFPNEDALFGSLMRRIGVEPTDNTKIIPLVYCELAHKIREERMCSISKQFILHGVKGKEQLKMHFDSALFSSVSSLCLGLPDSDDEMRDRCEYDK